MKKKFILSSFVMIVSMISMYGMGSGAEAASAGASASVTGIDDASAEYDKLSDLDCARDCRGQPASYDGEYANAPIGPVCMVELPQLDDEEEEMMRTLLDLVGEPAPGIWSSGGCIRRIERVNKLRQILVKIEFDARRSITRNDNVNTPSEEGVIPLVWAVDNKDYFFARSLLKAGANPSPDIDPPLLHRAVASKHKNIVKLLLRNGANRQQKDARGQTAGDLVGILLAAAQQTGNAKDKETLKGIRKILGHKPTNGHRHVQAGAAATASGSVAFFRRTKK